MTILTPDGFDAKPRRRAIQRWDWWIPLVTLALALLVAMTTAYRSYSQDTDQSDIGRKIAVLEQQQREADRRIFDTEQWRIRMEQKLDRILERLQP